MKIKSEDVKKSVIKQLLKVFPDVAVYKESQTQLVYPHFFVYQISLTDEEERRLYHHLSYVIDIRYRVKPDSSTDLKLQQNLDEASMKLLQNFNIIEFNNSKIRITNKTTEKVDGVLHFNFNVNFFAKIIYNEQNIKQNKLKLEIKNGG